MLLDSIVINEAVPSWLSENKVDDVDDDDDDDVDTDPDHADD